MIKTSFRRFYLDKFLTNSSSEFIAPVLDVGGKKTKQRGNFRFNQVYTCVNIDPAVAPDIICSAESLPFSNESFKTVTLIEVLEHLERPELVLQECYRVLDKDGVFILSVPFLVKVHADPYDFQRWTSAKLEMELKRIGFKNIEIKPMGKVFAVIYDLIRGYCEDNNSLFTLSILKVLKGISSLVHLFDRACNDNSKINTGYFVKCIKRS